MPRDACKRASWSSQRDFLLTCIGYAVGVSNIWRFPYLCLQNGGGVFLIPYLLTTVIVGIPMACLEFCLGQYVGLGLFPFWEICPLFKGVGLMALSVNIGLASYYIFVVVLAMYYFFASFSTVVPWKYCDHPWNTPVCHAGETDTVLLNNLTRLSNTSTTVVSTVYLSNTSHTREILHVSPAEEYLTNRVLRLGEGIEDIGTVNWRLFLCLVAAWLIVYLATINSVKSAGKVVYFTATFPYVMLTVFLIRGVTLPGSWTGLRYYLLPQWEKLLEPQVWYSAVQQVFLSLGVAYGCFTTLSSYNSFNNNFYRDAIVTTLVNSATSIYGGLAVFSVLGFMAHELNLSMSDVTQSGPGLAFITYPRAMATMPLTQLWSVLFFLMLIILGLGTEFVHFETSLACITDHFPSLRPIKRRIFLSTFAVLCLLAIGTIYTTNAGMYVFALVDWYCTPFPLILTGVLELIAFSWLYGVDTICENSKEMIGTAPNAFFKICWKFVSPAFLLLILIVNLATWKTVKYGEYVYPIYTNIIGWIIAILPVTFIFMVAVYKIMKSEKTTFSKTCQSLVKPSDWFYEHVKRRATSSKNHLHTSSAELDLLSQKPDA